VATPAPQPPEVPSGLIVPLALVDVQGQTREAAASNLIAQIRALLINFSGWYDDLAVRRLSREISGLVASTQRAVASHENAYLTNLISEQTGRLVRPAGDIGAEIVRGLRQGVDPEGVYQRLAVTFRYGVSRGLSEPEALRRVDTRAEVMSQMDTALAARAQAAKTLQATDLAVGYRRVIHPELTKGGTCGMCIVASDRIYRKRDLLPLHDRCQCDIAPILRGGKDPGSSLNNLDLGRLYEDAGGSSYAALVETRYQVDQHGELGPVLTPEPSTANPDPEPDPEPRSTGGSAAPPRKPPRSGGGNDGGGDEPPHGPEPEDPNSPEGRAYWGRRRDALGIGYPANEIDQIRPAEIKSVERLQARGGHLDYIPRDRSTGKPTNDYLWTPRGASAPMAIEIKSIEDATTLRPGTFPGRIIKAVAKSAVHGEEYRKRNFVLDAGDRLVTADIRRALRRFNLDNPNVAIERLWLLSRGSLEEIHLET